MKFKVVPEPRSVAFLREAQRALPLVPADENDCCARLVARTDLPSRDEARGWITFLQALGLVAETDSGFRRLRREPDANTLAEAFREHVFGAEDTLEILAAADSPLGAEAVFERFRDRVPNWERHRHADWETEWRERVRQLLGWALEFGLVERAGENYRVA